MRRLRKRKRETTAQTLARSAREAEQRESTDFNFIAVLTLAITLWCLLLLLLGF